MVSILVQRLEEEVDELLITPDYQFELRKGNGMELQVCMVTEHILENTPRDDSFRRSRCRKIL